MSNWVKGLAIGLLLVVLTACNAPAEPKKNTETGKPEKVQNESGMTAKEVYVKAMEASESQKSLHAKMNINHKIEIPSQDVNMNSNTKMDMDLIIEPMAIYQKMTMDMSELGAIDSEIYATDKGFFMYEVENNQWLMMPTEMNEEMITQMSGGASPTIDMSMFQKFADEFKFEQTDDEYILSIKASGEKFNELFKEVASDNMPPEMNLEEGGEDILESMNVKSVYYEIFIDKKTFHTNSFNMDLDLTADIDGEEMHMIQKMTAEISKINKIDKIEVPQEVLDNAVDVSSLMNE